MKMLLACLVCLLALLGNSVRGADALNMGFYLPGIRDANLADVKVTLKLWAEEVGKIYDIDATANTYADMASMRRDMQSGALNMVVAPGMEIAETFAADELAEGFNGKHRGTGEGLALIVRAAGEIKEFGQLRGRNVLRLANDRLSSVFLESRCRELARQACDDFLRIVDEKHNSQAIHKVFFGQADAALVSLSSLHAAGELNPQVRQRLRILLDWKTTSLAFGMMSVLTPPSLRARVIDSALRVATTVRGRQILEIFKTDYMERVDVHELQPYWSLHRESRDSAPGKLKRSR